MILYRMREEDCTEVVTIHLRSFQGFFLSFLGPTFLTVFYRNILCDPSGVCFVAEVDNRIAGFVVGSDRPDGLYRRLLKKHVLEFAWVSLKAFLQKPTILPRLLRAFLKPGEVMPEANCATLMSIAVDPDCQGGGVGKALVEAFLEEAAQRGAASVNLTTDAENNEKTNRFYTSLGFTLFRRFTTPEGRAMNEYWLRLPACNG